LSEAPTLFLLIDAIPFDLAHELWAAGDLPGFCEPRLTISAFPSLTEVAVPALLREIFPVRPPGYETRYYDPESGQIRGPGDAASEAALAPLRARPRGLVAHAVIYLLREQLAYTQIRWIGHRFHAEGGPWLGYLSATDGVGHFNGRDGLADALRDIAASVDRLRREHEREHGVLPGAVLCSDHGMAFGPLEHLPASELGERLLRAGFRLGGERDAAVTLVPFGDVGSGVVHSSPSRALEVAEAVSRAPGVELTFARTEGGFLALAEGGVQRARVRWREGAYRYEALGGDPLDYLPIWRELARGGRAREGWVQDADLFEATWRHRYPDALARVRHGLTDLVVHPAPVLFSMADSFTYGPSLVHAGARLLGQVGNHGALTTAQSCGFAAVSQQDSDPWPGRPALRPEEVFRPWAEVVRAGADEA